MKTLKHLILVATVISTSILCADSHSFGIFPDIDNTKCDVHKALKVVGNKIPEISTPKTYIANPLGGTHPWPDVWRKWESLQKGLVVRISQQQSALTQNDQPQMIVDIYEVCKIYKRAQFGTLEENIIPSLRITKNITANDESNGSIAKMLKEGGSDSDPFSNLIFELDDLNVLNKTALSLEVYFYYVGERNNPLHHFELKEFMSNTKTSIRIPAPKATSCQKKKRRGPRFHKLSLYRGSRNSCKR